MVKVILRVYWAILLKVVKVVHLDWASLFRRPWPLILKSYLASFFILFAVGEDN